MKWQLLVEEDTETGKTFVPTGIQFEGDPQGRIERAHAFDGRSYAAQPAPPPGRYAKLWAGFKYALGIQ